MFDSTNQNNNPPPKKKTYNDLEVIYFPYWRVLFNKLEIKEPIFKTKLAYNSKEHNKTLSISFFENELNLACDIYIELVNWEFQSFHEKSRNLYKLIGDGSWRINSNKYVKSINSQFDTYIVKVSDLELVNSTGLEHTFPVIETKMAAVEVVEDEEDVDYFSKDDDNLNTMTIRDQYCITQNIPLSNKEWLNKLIKKGNKWKLKELQKRE